VRRLTAEPERSPVAAPFALLPALRRRNRHTVPPYAYDARNRELTAARSLVSRVQTESVGAPRRGIVPAHGGESRALPGGELESHLMTRVQVATLCLFEFG
jgi:hypothetical protein